MKEKETSHVQRAAVAFGETILFTIAKHFWPPAEIGWLVTTTTFFLESGLAINDFNLQLKTITEKLEEWEKSDDHEPTPPDPRTTTLDQIETYKKVVLDAATQPPRKK